MSATSVLAARVVGQRVVHIESPVRFVAHCGVSLIGPRTFVSGIATCRKCLRVLAKRQNASDETNDQRK